MQKKLILVRHAAAEELTLQMADFDRKLLKKGIDDALLMGNWITQHVSEPFQIVTSSAARAKETAELIARPLHVEEPSIAQFDELYMEGIKGYLDVVNQTSEKVDHLVLVGHNPDIGFFAEYLSEANIGWMKKCSVVILQIENLEWAAVSSNTATFITYNYPRSVRESLL